MSNSLLRSARSLLALLVIATSAGAALAAGKTDDILKGVEDLQQQVLLLTKEQARSAEAIAEIRRRLEDQSGSSQTAQADLLQQVNMLLDEIQILRQKLEDTGFRLANLTQEMRRLQGAPGAGGAGGAAPAPAPGGPGSPGSPGAPAPPSAGKAPQRSQAGSAADAFQAAYSDYSKGNYELALWGFQDFLRKSPGDERTGEAIYWMGECHFSQKDYGKAIEMMDRLIQQYPNSPKVPLAHLKKGLAFLESNQVAQAVVQLQHLVQAYPHSDEARIARERLNGLGLR
jgi:tol-pal system protein YbgF